MSVNTKLLIYSPSLFPFGNYKFVFYVFESFFFFFQNKFIWIIFLKIQYISDIIWLSMIIFRPILVAANALFHNF